MIEINNIFAGSTKSEWIDQLTKDLKGQSLDVLQFNDPIENIDLTAYQHKDDDHHLLTQLSHYPYDRGFNRANNSWNNGIQVFISNENQANEFALEWLMKGVNFLLFIPQKENINWEDVLKNIGLEFIRSHFKVNNPTDIATLVNLIGDKEIQISFSAKKQQVEDQNLIDLLKIKQRPVFCVNAFELHQSGAASYQEIGYALNYGHELLVSLMNNGLSIDEAAACIHFQFGIGSKYLIESTKFSVFRALWSKIIHAYKPIHNCSHRAEITALTGHVNKSLKDPYTNLLRQTTEALSAVNGGVNNLLVTPYDQYSNQSSPLALRMAVNISLILAEESHLDKVIDPLGGSYVMDAISTQLSDNSWNFFLELEKLENDTSLSAFLNEQVSQKRNQRIDAVRSGNEILIGINKFPNPETSNLNWKNIPEAKETGLATLILENEIV